MSSVSRNSILDYEFLPGQRARLLYWSGNALDQSHYINVEIVEPMWAYDGKWYIVKGRKSLLENTTLDYQDDLQEHFENINTDYAMFMVDPDELMPEFESGVDNTI